MATPYLYVSFHGGSSKNAWNNIHVFTLAGKNAPFKKALDKSTFPKGVKMSELRDFRFGPDNKLYVVNAHKKYNQIIRFKRKSGNKPFTFDAIFSENNKEQIPALVHPFQMAFTPQDNLLASCQDTNTVWAAYGPNATKTKAGTSMPIAAAYKKQCTCCFLGTFVPSNQKFPTHYSLKMVRGIAFGPDQNLYVADETLNAVNVFNGQTGAFIKTLVSSTNYPNLEGPVHLLFHGATLYIGNKKENTVLMVDTAATNPKIEVFINNASKKIDAPAGMCFTEINGTLKFLLASRKSKSVLQYNISTTGKGIYEKILLSKLKDNPEFIKVF